MNHLPLSPPDYDPAQREAWRPEYRGEQPPETGGAPGHRDDGRGAPASDVPAHLGDRRALGLAGGVPQGVDGPGDGLRLAAAVAHGLALPVGPDEVAAVH